MVLIHILRTLLLVSKRAIHKFLLFPVERDFQEGGVLILNVSELLPLEIKQAVSISYGVQESLKACIVDFSLPIYAENICTIAIDTNFRGDF